MLVRVLEIGKFTGTFHFGGGEPQIWHEVDWFRDDPSPFNGNTFLPDNVEQVIEIIKRKGYYDPSKSYLVLHPTCSFTINYTAP